MIRILMRIAVLLLAVLATGPLSAQQYPAEPGNGVADLAGIIEAADADSLRATVAALRTEAGVEVRVLTVQNIAGYGTADPTPEAFATAVYNDWKLGYGQRQDGVLVLVSVDDRFARIELGDQVPVHQDARMQEIIDNEMVPHFREGNYGEGVMAGVRAIATSFRDPYGVMSPRLADEAGEPQTAYDEPSTESSDGVSVVIAVVIGLVIAVLSLTSGGTQGAYDEDGGTVSHTRDSGSTRLWSGFGGGSSRGKSRGGGGSSGGGGGGGGGGGSSSGRGASGRW